MYRTVINYRYAKLLINLDSDDAKKNPPSIVECSRDIKMSYGYFTQAVLHLMGENILEKTHKGRETHLRLTPKGQRISKLLKKLDIEIKKW